MLQSLVGSANAERVLLFLAAREKGYAREIATAFDVAPSQVQRVLERMERDGILVAQSVGRTRVYEFNPRYAFKDDVIAMATKALGMLPPAQRDRLVLDRRRPRRKGKPL